MVWKRKTVWCACKHLTLYSHWNGLYIISTVASRVCVCARECEWVRVSGWQEDERRQTQQLHHDCNIWAIYDLFMHLICYWGRDVCGRGEERCWVKRRMGGCMDGSNKSGEKSIEFINLSVSRSDSRTARYLKDRFDKLGITLVYVHVGRRLISLSCLYASNVAALGSWLAAA